MSGRSRWGDAMRCLVCGAEMRLEEIALDETAPVSGFQRHTFKCSSCGDVEERLAFVKEHSQANAVASAPENEDDGQRLTGVSEAEPNFADAVPLDPESPVLLTSAPENEHDVAPSLARDVCGDIEQPLTLVSEAVPATRMSSRQRLSPATRDVSDPLLLDAENASVLLTSAPENKDAVAPSFAKDVCGDIEQPLTLVSEAESSHADAIPPDLVPPVSPPSAAETEDGVAPTFANRVAAKLSRICRAVGRRLSHGGGSARPCQISPYHTSRLPCEPVSDQAFGLHGQLLLSRWQPATTSSTLVSRESDSYVDECGNLLRRAQLRRSVSKSPLLKLQKVSLRLTRQLQPLSRPCEAELETLTTALRRLEAESAALRYGIEPTRN
jgi:hypothetical protein